MPKLDVSSTRVKQLAESLPRWLLKLGGLRSSRGLGPRGIFHTATRADPPGGVDPDELLKYATTSRFTWRTTDASSTAQQIAGHESPRTTKLYDRTKDEITLNEMERIRQVRGQVLVAKHLKSSYKIRLKQSCPAS